jgi:glycerol-3-phosphate dehydrogenase
LIIERGRLPISDAVVMTEAKRVLFAIPWGERVILGTTDTDYAGTLDEVHTEARDVDYILGVVNRAFPDARLDRGDVVSTWAGLRPLVGRNHGKPSDISRAHLIRQPEPGWLDVAGGKLTTYRRIAEQVVDRVFGHLGHPSPPCRTAELPLLEQDMAGGEVSGILPPAVCAEAVHHYCTNEWALHLDDVMVRRTSWRYYHRTDEEIAERVGRWMAQILGWDRSQHDAELSRYLQVTR